MQDRAVAVAKSSLCGLAICVLVGISVIPSTAEASIDAVVVNASRDYEHAKGYIYAEITLRGSVARADGSMGQYSVPAIIIYPKRSRGRGVGVVDWLNSAFYHFFPPDTEFGTFEFTLYATGNHLFDEGYTYLTIQWNKRVTEIFGPTVPKDGAPHNHLLYGRIERSADAWEILLDAARLLKDPGAFPGERPAPVATVLSSGFSQGGAAQLEFLAEGLDPARVYDGHLIQMIGLACWKRVEVSPHFGSFGECSPLPTDGNHAPVMVLASETDMLIYPSLIGVGKSAFFARNPTNPNWRQYELSGVSHLTRPILKVDVDNQNTADARPVFRAAFDNLARWSQSRGRIKPPASRHFEGHIDASGAFIPEMDDDGHFAGGLRLPHVESVVHSHGAGAPLGTYTPLNPLGGTDPFKVISGTFTRFKDDVLLARYPSKQQYVKRVERAADALAAQGYITNKDRKGLVSAAREEPLPSSQIGAAIGPP